MKLPLTDRDYQTAADLLKCEVASIHAVADVEAPNGGFNPDDTPVTLFEGHKFHAFTGGIYDASHPHLSYARWTRKYYGRTWQQEQQRLQEALALDRHAALSAASWGKFQLMGFNSRACGFNTLQAFVNAMYESEMTQLLAFVGFITSQGMAESLREKDWAAFADAYNGPAYEENQYDIRMAAAYKKHSQGEIA